jgi:transcriptional regulator NrdR family protein
MEDDDSEKSIDREEEYNFLLNYLDELKRKNEQSQIEEEKCNQLIELYKNEMDEIRIKEIEISKELDDYIMEIQSLKQITFIRTRFLESKFKNHFEIIMNKLDDEYAQNLEFSEHLLPLRIRDIDRVQFLLDVIIINLF